MTPTALQNRDLDPRQLDLEPTDWDRRAYWQLASTELSAAQRNRVAQAPFSDPRQTEVLGLHWHPEFVPLDVIRTRLDAMFPARQTELIIPTQHNVLTEYDGYAGVEIDCYSAPFARKVQLLAHFAADRIREAHAFQAMLAHTYKYRASQLYEYIDSLLEPAFHERVVQAAVQTGASEALVVFVRAHVARLKALIDEFHARTPADMLKNKLIRNYFSALRALYDGELIGHAQTFLTAVKAIVKQNFALTYFYATRDIIAEVRGLGGALVIPHPEQFWPILLADYDVDAIEVWNPQSREYTEFLIQVVHRQNKSPAGSERPLLITMGDDTHFGEKVLEPAYQDREKAGRELGLQPAWDDVAIRKSLCVAGMDRARVIAAYKERLG